MILYNRPELHIQHDVELSLIRTSWTGAVGAEYLRPCATYITSLVQHQQPRHYLMDLGHLDDISVSDQIWLSNSWLPSMQLLPLKRVVLLMDERRIHNKMAVESIIATRNMQLPFEIQYFGEPLTALRWLTDDSPKVAALFAEWNKSFPLVAVRHPLQAALSNRPTHNTRACS